MQAVFSKWFTIGVLPAAVFGMGAVTCAAEAPSAKLALSFRPVQSGVECETPSAAEIGKCEVKVERSGKSSGWVVLGPNGQVLRRFVDTNADNVVDQWRYYNQGLEVYRDIDSNFNNKVDQSRWLNTGGVRWALDNNEDGRIDAWTVLSAEEATQEAVRALVERDAAALQSVLITREDLKKLGIADKLAKRLLDAISDPEKQIAEVWSNSKTLSAKTRWVRFDSSMPSAIPVEQDKTSSDLYVYENAMAIAQTGEQHTLLRIGEMIRVGEVWKLTQVPVPLEGNSLQVTAGGLLMQPTLASSTGVIAGGGDINPESQKLLEQLQKLDENIPGPDAGSAKTAAYNARRAELMEKLIQAAASDEERAQWVRQMADSIAAAVQLGSYPAGVERLTALEEAERKVNARSDTYAYVFYRRLLAEYNSKVQSSKPEEQEKIQSSWLSELERFTKEHPTAVDAPEAMLQLAISHEYSGRPDEARRWYQSLAKGHGNSEPGVRAAGALRRLDLKGKAFQLSGTGLDGGTIEARQFQGKVLLVIYWSTHCRVCTEDLPQLRELYAKYRGRGFEILGINLDATAEPVRPFLMKHRVTWPQIYEEGSLLSGPAAEFGVILQPTMFLVDRSGKVISENVTVADVKEKLPDLMK